MFRRIAILGAIAFGILSSSLVNTGCGLDGILPGKDPEPYVTSGIAPPPGDYSEDQDNQQEDEQEDDEETE